MNNESYPQMLMPVIQNVIPHQDQSKSLKKCMFLYWEIVDKFKPDGKVKDEVFLTTHNFRLDLMHPNEFVAGRALRLVAQIPSKMIIKPLLEPITSNCLDHIEAYVRRYAVVCLSQIYDNFGEDIMPDLEEKLQNILEKETDLTTKRNAFSLYFRVNREKCLEFLLDAVLEEEHESFGDILQLAVLKDLQESVVKHPKDASKMMKVIKQFQNSRFNAVLYEVASSLIKFNQNEESLKIAMSILHQILKNNTDNNVKLLILDQYDLIRRRNPKLMADDFISVLKVVFTGDYELRKRFMAFCSTFVNTRNYSEVKRLLVEENKHVFGESNIPVNYQIEFMRLIFALSHEGVITGEELNTMYIPTLLVSSSLNNETFDILRMLLLSYLESDLRIQILKTQTQICRENVMGISNPQVLELVISTIGKHVISEKDSELCLKNFVEGFGSLPLKAKDSTSIGTGQGSESEPAVQERQFITKTVVRDDGTYGEEQVEVTAGNIQEVQGEEAETNIRKNCIQSLAFCTKILKATARLLCNIDLSSTKNKKLLGRIVMMACEMLRYHQTLGISDHSLLNRISGIIRLLTQKKYIKNYRYTFKHLLEVRDRLEIGPNCLRVVNQISKF